MVRSAEIPSGAVRCCLRGPRRVPDPLVRVPRQCDRYMRRGLWTVKPLASVLRCDYRSERAVAFAPFDLAIDPVFHLGARWIGQNGAVAERSGPELRAAAHDADDLTVREAAGRLCGTVQRDVADAREPPTGRERFDRAR